MANFMDYIALGYTLILTPLYVFFTIRLGWKLYYKKTPDLINGFFPILFFKGCVDNTTNIVQLLTGRILKFRILEDFFLNNDYPAYILYFTTATTYCLMYQITFLIAFNRYVAMTKPTKYKELFQFKRLHTYIVLTLIPGLISGLVAICFKLDYVWYPSLNRVLPVYTQSGIEYYHATFSIVFNLPLLCITTWMNVKSFLKDKKVFTKLYLINSIDSQLFLYNIISFVTMIGFEFYYFSRYVPYILKELMFLEAIAVEMIPWFLDIMTYGLWILSMIILKPLRLLMPCFKK
uniref:7TM_GPCR_Srx domain-containing protein n=1 Tax=Parastrongyloides trichosuri TaxID=131310 RepID=A0A0N4ZLP5_PARTI